MPACHTPRSLTPALPLGESGVTSRMGSVSPGAGNLGGFWAEVSERAWGAHRQAGRGSGGGWLWPVPALKCSQGPGQRTVGSAASSTADRPNWMR